ncbi:MAG: phosphocholine cytidylyltransferase family protein [Gemmatimonadaceae bacterium]
MQAIILAAGFGSRLAAVTGGKSKALVEIGGRPLILHQLEALADHGVGPVLVIVGHQADEAQKIIGDRAQILLNDRFAETNSLYSLWLARDWIKGPFLLLNCDLFFDPKILDRVLEEPGNVLAYDSTSSRGREQTKVAIKQRRVVDIGKDVPASSARGESLGMLKFERDGADAMVRVASELIGGGNESAWVIEATRSVCREIPIYGVNVAGEAWAEIDFPYDLDVARREVWPAIYRGRWRKLVLWKRTRWAALAAAAATLLLGGWAASTRLGPASVNWQTVPAIGAEMARLERHGKTQRWWSVTLGTPVTAQVSGPEALIELRLVLPAGTSDSLRYVVKVTVDGRPLDWRALTAVPDTSARLAGLAVGDRDRIRIALPPGEHELGVALLDGHADRLLVRVRQPEEREE